MYQLEFGGKWTIAQLEPGSIFRFADGELAIKTAYRTDGKSDCYLLDGGSAVGNHVPDDTEVTMLKIVHDGDDA